MSTLKRSGDVSIVIQAEWPDLVILLPDSLQILPDLVTKSLNLVTLNSGKLPNDPMSLRFRTSRIKGENSDKDRLSWTNFKIYLQQYPWWSIYDDVNKCIRKSFYKCQTWTYHRYLQNLSMLPKIHNTLPILIPKVSKTFVDPESKTKRTKSATVRTEWPDFLLLWPEIPPNPATAVAKSGHLT